MMNEIEKIRSRCTGEPMFLSLEQKVLPSQESNPLFGEGFTVDSSGEGLPLKNFFIA